MYSLNIYFVYNNKFFWGFGAGHPANSLRDQGNNSFKMSTRTAECIWRKKLVRVIKLKSVDWKYWSLTCIFCDESFKNYSTLKTFNLILLFHSWSHNFLFNALKNSNVIKLSQYHYWYFWEKTKVCENVKEMESENQTTRIKIFKNINWEST